MCVSLRDQKQDHASQTINTPKKDQKMIRPPRLLLIQKGIKIKDWDSRTISNPKRDQKKGSKLPNYQ